MRGISAIIVMLVVVGCASSPEPNADLARACMTERTAVIQQAWARYESVTGERVFFPDWRSQARQWAYAECMNGRPVAAYYPADTATARRQY